MKIIFKISIFLCLSLFLFQNYVNIVKASGTCVIGCYGGCSATCTNSCGVVCCHCSGACRNAYCGCGSSGVIFCGYDPLGTVCNPCDSYCRVTLKYTSPASTCNGNSVTCPSCSYTSSCSSDCGAVPACNGKSNSGNDYCTVGQACQSGTCVSGQKCTSRCECSVTTTSTTSTTSTSTTSTSTTSTTTSTVSTTTSSSTTTTIVTCPYPASYPSNYWDRVWCDMSFTSKLADAPDEGNIQFDNSWGAGILAAGRADNIGFRSGRTISLPSTGTYIFTVGSDDGVRVWIDGNSVLDKWIDKGYSTDTFTKDLNAGNHQFRIDYYENVGDARVSFSYTNPSSTTTTISSTTSTTTTSTTTSTSTTTTISITNIPCSGTTNYDCSAPQDSIDSIDSIIAPSYPLNCGNNVNIAVQWTGYHYGDANHWGFFIEDHGQYIPVGNCISYVDGEISPHTKYNMSCYVNIPQAGDINNGTYNLWVTGSDANGYCNPLDDGTYDEKYTSITLTGCGYTPPCSNCPKKVTPDECRVVCNNVGESNPTRCKCLSNQEWYVYDVTCPLFEVWINAIPTSNVDVSLYATSDKSCPTTSSSNCFNNSFGSGQKEMCHFPMGEMYSPQYFLVNKVSGPSYDQNNYYDIILTCKPDPSCLGSTSLGMLLSVPPNVPPYLPNTNDTYYKITNPVPGRTVIVTLQPYSGTDYSLYCSKAPNLFPFLGTTKPYVYYSNNAGYGGQETCTFTVPISGTYYYLVHHAKGGYGYSVKWEYSGPSSTTTTIYISSGGGGGGRMPLMIGVTEVLNNPIVILVALIAIVVIIYGAFKFFAMPKKHR